MKIYLNSIETLGLVDGPGIRVVVFMQGCPLRCIYCHNPETWQLKDYKMALTPEELVAKIKRYQPYFGQNGGVTFSGGEPIMQKEALLKTLKLCQENNIHTALDTAGTITDVAEILKYTDLVILDIKGIGSNNYSKITKGTNTNLLQFLHTCQKLNKPLWLRDVIIPNINDNESHLNSLIEFIKPLKNVQKVELLPYHTLGVSKYNKLNLFYPLKDTPPMDSKKCHKMEEYINSKLNK